MNEILKEYKINQYKDQFTQVTRTVRRNLLIVSSVVILLTIEGITLKPTFGLDFSSNMAKGAIAIVIIYELITFFIYALIDYRNWSIEKEKVLYEFKEKTIDNYISNLEPIGTPVHPEPCFNENDEENIQMSYYLKIDKFKEVISEAKKNTTEYNKETKKFSNSIKNTNYIQLFRIYVIDWSIPILIALFALYRSTTYIYDFFKGLL